MSYTPKVGGWWTTYSSYCSLSYYIGWWIRFDEWRSQPQCWLAAYYESLQDTRYSIRRWTTNRIHSRDSIADLQCVVEILQVLNLLLRNARLPTTWGPTHVIHSPRPPVLPPKVPVFLNLKIDLGVGNTNEMSSSSFYSNTTAFPQWAPSTSMTITYFEDDYCSFYYLWIGELNELTRSELSGHFLSTCEWFDLIFVTSTLG